MHSTSSSFYHICEPGSKDFQTVACNWLGANNPSFAQYVMDGSPPALFSPGRWILTLVDQAQPALNTGPNNCVTSLLKLREDNNNSLSKADHCLKCFSCLDCLVCHTVWQTIHLLTWFPVNWCFFSSNVNLYQHWWYFMLHNKFLTFVAPAHAPHNLAFHSSSTARRTDGAVS